MASRANAFVVDASVAAKWHLKDEEYAAESALLLAQFAQGHVELIAPSHVNYEVASAITAAARGQNPRLSQTDGRSAIERFLALGISTVDDPELILQAYRLAHLYGCALYDGLYVALSQRLRLPLILADRKLYQLIGHLQGIVWIGDYLPASST
jgi:predicted nucleic acid-binding protein